MLKLGVDIFFTMLLNFSIDNYYKIIRLCESKKANRNNVKLVFLKKKKVTTGSNK